MGSLYVNVDIDIPSKLRDVIEIRPNVINLLGEKFDVKGKPYAPYLCYQFDYNKLTMIVFFVEYDVAEKLQREKYENGDAFAEIVYSSMDAFNNSVGSYEFYRSKIEDMKRQQALRSGWEQATGKTSEIPPVKIISKFAGIGRKRLTRKRRSNHK